MSVEQARDDYAYFARLSPGYAGYCERFRRYSHCQPCSQFHQLTDAASLALDNATAEAISGDDTPGAGPTWSQRRRAVQQIRWMDALHRTLLKSVAW